MVFFVAISFAVLFPKVVLFLPKMFLPESVGCFRESERGRLHLPLSRPPRMVTVGSERSSGLAILWFERPDPRSVQSIELDERAGSHDPTKAAYREIVRVVPVEHGRRRAARPVWPELSNQGRRLLDHAV